MTDRRAVVVTGGASAIGSAISTGLARAGWPVVLTYQSDATRATALADSINASADGSNSIAMPFDLAEPNSARRLVDSVSAVDLEVGALVHNAVAWPNRSATGSPMFAAQSSDHWRQATHCNVDGTFELLNEVIPSVVSRPNGRVVLISSNIALDGMAGSVVYAGVKASLHGMARSLAWELGPAGATVNVVAPGLTETERIGAIPKAAVDGVVNQTPIGRLVVAEEVAAAVEFLCSEAASGITGQLLNVSGGVT